MRRAVLLLLIALMILPAVAVQAADCPYRDGRLNDRPHRDCGAPVAIYQTDSRITIVATNPSGGIAGPMIDAARNVSEIPTSGNVILETATNPFSGRPGILSRLTTGEYQFNTFFADGEAYTVVWFGYDDLYHLDPVTGAPLDGAQPIVVDAATNPSAGASAGAPTNAPSSSGGGSRPIASEVDSATNTLVLEPGELLPQGESAPGAVAVNNCRIRITRIVRLRSAPDTNSLIFTRLPYDSTWRVTERLPDWYRVVYENTQGWVAAQFADPIGTCDL